MPIKYSTGLEWVCVTKRDQNGVIRPCRQIKRSNVVCVCERERASAGISHILFPSFFLSGQSWKIAPFSLFFFMPVASRSLSCFRQNRKKGFGHYRVDPRKQGRIQRAKNSNMKRSRYFKINKVYYLNRRKVFRDTWTCLRDWKSVASFYYFALNFQPCWRLISPKSWQ